MKRILALGLIFTLALTLWTPALALRAGSGGPKAVGKFDTSLTAPVVIPSSPTLSFGEIGARVRANNLTIQSFQESLASARAMDLDAEFADGIEQIEDALDSLDDALDTLDSAHSALENTISAMSGTSTALPDSALRDLQAAFSSLSESGTVNTAALAQSIAAISAATSTATYLGFQAQSLQTDLASFDEQKESLKDQREDLEDQLKDLKEEKDKQKRQLEKTLQDTERQFQNTVDQLIYMAQSTYLGIQSGQLQLEALYGSKTATERMATEMRLRYDLGQISAQTLTQIENALLTIDSGITSAENGLVNAKASLQSLLGEVPNGELTLLDTPAVTAAELAAMDYASDLETAKAHSYTLYSAGRTVEKAQDDLDDAYDDHGSDSHQYKMAEHTYQSSVLQQASAESSFELSFQTLYRAIAPAQATLGVKQADLAYQQDLLRTAELKYQQGNLSANGLEEAKEAVATAQRDVDLASLDLFIAWHAYRQAVDLGLISATGS